MQNEEKDTKDFNYVNTYFNKINKYDDILY